VWHASARSPFGEVVVQAMLERALRGVGDASVGEWYEPGTRGSGVYHLRRRLHEGEAMRVNTVCDIRGTEQEQERLRALLRDAPHLAAVVRA
jgi:hypothetical protein